jgi:hypothetical protein
MKPLFRDIGFRCVDSSGSWKLESNKTCIIFFIFVLLDLAVSVLGPQSLGVRYDTVSLVTGSISSKGLCKFAHQEPVKWANSPERRLLLIRFYARTFRRVLFFTLTMGVVPFDFRAFWIQLEHRSCFVQTNRLISDLESCLRIFQCTKPLKSCIEIKNWPSLFSFETLNENRANFSEDVLDLIKSSGSFQQ